MESLGGDRYWGDRFIAQHIAVAYYWVVVSLYMLFPQYAYYLMELIEAYHTYDNHLKTYEAELKTLPAPQVAINYYRDGDTLFVAIALRKLPETALSLKRLVYRNFLNGSSQMRASSIGAIGGIRDRL
jgi:hypothetical protein